MRMNRCPPGSADIVLVKKCCHECTNKTNYSCIRGNPIPATRIFQPILSTNPKNHLYCAYFLSNILSTRYFDITQSTISKKTMVKEGISARSFSIPMIKKTEPIRKIEIAKSFCPVAQMVSFLRVQWVVTP